MTTKLIQELLGLCEDKSDKYSFFYDDDEKSFHLFGVRIKYYESVVSVTVRKQRDDAPQLLQEAIERVRQL